MKSTLSNAAVVLVLVLTCRTCLCEVEVNVQNHEVQENQETSSFTGPTAERDLGSVGVASGESRGNGAVGVPADPDPRQQLPTGAFPPRIVLPGSPRPPPAAAGQRPPVGFPPLGTYEDVRPPPGAAYPGQFPSRPLPGPPPPGGPYPPTPFPQRPFPGQRPPRPPPIPSFGDPNPSFFNPFLIPPLPSNIVNRAVLSVTEFDDRRCVPRLLCELTSGSMPGVYSGGYRPYRPYRPASQGESFVGQEQLLQLLAALTLGNPDGSPLSFFGGAALLGISSRGRPEHCYKAFPECPQDSNSLLQYLNNHRGGFFKALGEPLRSSFPGPQSPDGPVPRPPRPPPRPYPPGPQQPYPQGPQQPYPLGPQQPYPLGPQQPYPPQPQGQLSPRPLNYYAKANEGSLFNSTDGAVHEVDNVLAASGDSEARIQVHPDHVVGLINSNQPLGLANEWRFPLANSDGKKTKFPPSQNLVVSEGYRKGLRKGKKIGQLPSIPKLPVLPLLPPIQEVFPDRTGTGDLRLDNWELFGTKNRPGIQDTGANNGGTRYGRIYFPRDVENVSNRPGEINTRHYIIFPGPAS